MKKRNILLLMTLFFIYVLPIKSNGQSIAQDLEQLQLDYQKLAGLKSILKQMYQGYEVVNKGYNSVKSVAQGNFTLHQTFLDGLMVVSPTVRKYPRVADIITEQSQLVREYKSAFSAFRQDAHFNPDEVSYMADIYNNLVSASLKNLNELSMVMSDNKLRMSDNERLQAIDRIYGTGHEQLTYLRKFNDNTQTVAIERARQAGDQQTLRTLYGIN